MAIQLLYKHDNVLRPAFGLCALYRAPMLETAWSDSMGMLDVPDTVRDVILCKPGALYAARSYTITPGSPLIVELNSIHPALFELRSRLASDADSASQKFRSLCRMFVSDFLSIDGIARVLWDPAHAGDFAWGQFSDNPAGPYSAVVLSCATTIRFAFLHQDTPSQNAKDALACLDATLNRLISVQAMSGEAGYLPRWNKAGYSPSGDPSGVDWTPHPQGKLISGCSFSTQHVNAAAEPSIDEYTFYAGGLGMAVKALLPIDFGGAWAGFEAVRQKLSLVHFLCLEYLERRNYLLTRPCWLGTTTQVGSTGHLYSYAFRACKRQSLGSLKQSATSKLSLIGITSPGVIAATFVRAASHSIYGAKATADNVWKEWGMALAYSLLLPIPRSIGYQAAGAINLSLKGFNRAHIAHLSISAYEDDLVGAVFLKNYAGKPGELDLALPAPPESAMYAPLTLATRVLLGACWSRSDGGAWMANAEARLSAFLDDGGWVSGKDSNDNLQTKSEAFESAVVETHAAANGVANMTSRYFVGFPGKNPAAPLAPQAQGDAMNRLNALVAYSVMCLALDLEPLFEWSRPASALQSF